MWIHSETRKRHGKNTQLDRNLDRTLSWMWSSLSRIAGRSPMLLHSFQVVDNCLELKLKAFQTEQIG